MSVLEFDLGHFTSLDLGKRKEKKRGGGGVEELQLTHLWLKFKLPASLKFDT